MARRDELRLMGKVARMYYHQGLTQTEIMRRLDIHQSSISRLLRRARQQGIVRIIVSAPSGTHPDLEEQLETSFGLKEAIVIDASDNEERLARDLGAAAAFLLETTLKPVEVIGISCWSASLLATVEALHPTPLSAGSRVVQILGGLGSPGAPMHATNLTRRLATLLSAEVTMLPAPGVVGSEDARKVLLAEDYVQDALRCFGSVTTALVGIGATEPSRMLASSGNVFSPQALQTLEEQGAVGDICMRFFNQHGHPVRTALDNRVISMELEQLRTVPRVIAVAGGRRKTAAIRGALVGRWVNVLITDHETAVRLLELGPGGPVEQAPAQGSVNFRSRATKPAVSTHKPGRKRA